MKNGNKTKKSGVSASVPLGLSSALAANPQALRRFTGMTEQQRRQVIEQTSTVTSKAEMRQLVERLNTENF